MNMFNSVELRRPRFNKFDLSHDRKFSMHMGALVPILCEDVLPGDRWQVDSESLIRFAPMLAPIMHRVRVRTHFFFVPNRIIWDEFETFITGGPDGTDAPLTPFFRLANDTGKFAMVKGNLMDYLGFPPIDSSSLVANEIDFSALPARAYNTIWNEYYRDQNLTEPLAVPKTSGAQTATQMLEELILRAVCWQKDQFTSALPFAQRGPAVAMPFDVDWTYKDTSEAFKSPVGSGAPAFGAIEGTPGGLEDAANDPIYIDNIQSIDSSSVTIRDLRRAEALQKWYEKNATGGARYTEQIYVHFGVRGDDARMQRPEYLGGGMQTVSISEVVATATEATEAIPQGNMSGHGVSLGRTNKFSRRFKEHGWVIGLMSVLPDTAYQQGIPRKLTRFDKLDYAWPLFANIGEQEIKLKELWYDQAESDPEVNDSTFGYQNRYYEYKYIPSSVHSDFRDNLAFWHMGRIFSAKPELNEEFVTADPTRRIFAVETENTEPLWCHCYNRINAIRPLPYFGTPTL